MKRVAEIKDFQELNLPDSVMRTIARHGHSIYDVVALARFNDIPAYHLKGLGRNTVAKLVEAADNAGLTFHESPASAGVRRLFCSLFNYEMRTNEDYEAQTEFSEEQIEALKRLINRILKEREVRMLIQYYGIDGAEPKPLKRIAEAFKLSAPRVGQIVWRAERNLRLTFKNLMLLKDFSNFEGIPSELRGKLQTLNGDRSSLEEMPTAALSIPFTITKKLLRAGYRKLGSILQLSDHELLEVLDSNDLHLQQLRKTIDDLSRS